MTIETIYTCDKCGKKASESGAVLTVVLTIESEPTNYAIDRKHYKKDYCYSCLKEMTGWRIGKKEREKLDPPPLTMEDLIREICQETVTDMTGAL